MTARFEFDLAIIDTLDSSEAAILAELDRAREESGNKVIAEFKKIREQLGLLEGGTSIEWDHVWNLTTDGNDSKGSVNLTPLGAVVFDNAAKFDGFSGLFTTDVVTMQNPIFTVSCWSRIITPSEPSIIWMFERNNSNEGLCVFVRGDLTVEAQILQTSGYATFRSIDSVVVLDKRQHHVLTGDGSVITYYLNGLEVFSFPYDGTLDTTYIERLVIGSEIIGADTPRNGIFGNIDTVRYASKAITAEQVDQLYSEEV